MCTGPETQGPAPMAQVDHYKNVVQRLDSIRHSFYTPKFPMRFSKKMEELSMARAPEAGNGGAEQTAKPHAAFHILHFQ